MQSVLLRPQVTVIQPMGLISAAAAVKFQHQLNAAVLSDQNFNLLVDLGEVELIDSTGLMALVSALSMAQRLNKRLGLCAVSRPVRMILELSQLDRVFEIFDGQGAFNDAIA